MSRDVKDMKEEVEKYIKCEICEKPALKNSVICSNKCSKIRLKRLEIMDKYAHPNGCENCWGDLHQGCAVQCQREFQRYGELGQDLWELIKLSNLT